MNDKDWDKNPPDCENCGRCYDGKECRWCYFINAAEDTWIKITDKKNFDMPSLMNFIVYAPKIQNHIFHVMFCDTDRKWCRKLHIAAKHMAYGDEEISLKDCTHWRKLPSDPNGKQIIFDYCGSLSSEHY